MTEQSRARRFDGFDRPKTDAAQIPESGLDRILEALTRSRAYLPAATEAKLAELWDRDTALSFAVLLALWAGLQFTPVGWLADLLLAATGFLTMAGDLVELVLAAKAASDAETDEQLDQSARQLASALTASAADVVAGVIGGVAFSKLRRLVKLSRAKLLPRRFAGGSEGRLTLSEVMTASASGVALERVSIAAAKKKKELEAEASSVLWAAGAAAGAVILVGGLVALARRTP